MRHGKSRDDADGCLPVFLRMHRMRHTATPQARRLLCLLFLRIGALPADPGGGRWRSLLSVGERRPHHVVGWRRSRAGRGAVRTAKGVRLPVDPCTSGRGSSGRGPGTRRGRGPGGPRQERDWRRAGAAVTATAFLSLARHHLRPAAARSRTPAHDPAAFHRGAVPSPTASRASRSTSWVRGPSSPTARAIC